MTPSTRLARWAAAFDAGAGTHYSQEGEDILLQRIFAEQARGFYVDVGAHHPRRFSNTYWAYRLGWRGVNIDGAPGSRRLFERSRPRDTNVERCISDSPGEVTFYVYDETALNTSSPQRRHYVDELLGEPARTARVLAQPLGEILHEAVPPGQTIDFMSIDIEGSEMVALRTNDWQHFTPRVLVMEALGITLETLGASAEIAVARAMGFTPVAMLYHSVILVSDQTILAEHWGIDEGRRST